MSQSTSSKLSNHQVEGLDHHEIFSLVTKISTVDILLAVVAPK